MKRAEETDVNRAIGQITLLCRRRFADCTRTTLVRDAVIAGSGLTKDSIDRLLLWILVGVILGARLYYVFQNDFSAYVIHPWRVFAVWEGGLAFFGGLGGGIAAAYLCCRHYGFDFWEVSDVFTPAIPIAAAIGRISCGLDGMDYGTPTAAMGSGLSESQLVRTRGWCTTTPRPILRTGRGLGCRSDPAAIAAEIAPRFVLFVYLIAFSGLRFFVFFFRGNVAPVGLGLKNAQWTALAILVVSVAAMLWNRSPPKNAAPA